MTTSISTPDAYRTFVDRNGWRPRNVVWELTLACNLRCRHCGSGAGDARPDEMSLDECLVVADDLGALGAELVTLSGGEPTLMKGWDVLAKRLTDHGVLVNMVTNGVYRTGEARDEIIARAKAAGMCNVGISIDGRREIHDRIRGVGTFAQSVESIRAFTAAGIRVGVLTTINRWNYGQLEDVRSIAIEAGATLWRLQLGKPMGNMAAEDLTITTDQYEALLPRLARLKQDKAIRLGVGDSIGYYGPHDRVLRGKGWRGRKEIWKGCQAGMHAIGIEADGGIKGCLSLQAKQGDHDPFREANLREARLTDLWYRPGIFAYNRAFDPASLEGDCKACRFAALCRGGARCVASAVTGDVKEDPYCWYRIANRKREEQVRHHRASGAAVAAAVALSLGTAGCDSDNPKPKDTVSEPDNCCQPEYGVEIDSLEPPADTTPGPDIQVDYGMMPDTIQDAVPDLQMDYGIDPDIADPKDTAPDLQMEYGIIPDLVSDTAPEVQMDYGIMVDVVGPKDTIDCDTVCCECEYGVIPDEVWKKCCAPDPCENVCCECDYGEPPPPECCP
ncbi:MAG: radical SAM protein [Pseudomonadota bacterium]